MNCRFPLLPLILLLLLAGLSACRSATTTGDYSPLVARFFLETKPGEPGLALRLPVSEVTVNVEARPVIVEYDIVNAEVARVELGPCLMLQLSPAAARDFYRLSVANVGRRLVLVLNDAPVGARRIEQAMADGVILVFVEGPDAELPSLVARIKRTSQEISLAAKKND